MKKRISKNIREQLVLSTALLLLAYVTLKIFDKVNEIQPTPYIDEIFHIPQAQSYCRNAWTEWNPKITTLPGLYLVSYTLLKPLGVLRDTVCNVYSLRFVNVIGTLINFVLSYKIISMLHNPSGSKNFSAIIINVISAVNVAILPPLYFFTFLYYTDVWSLTFVLLMYYGHITASPASKLLVGVSGFLAVLMRQTNIIWVGFMIMDDVWSVLTKNTKSVKVQDFRFTIDTLKSLLRYFWKSKKGKRKGSSGSGGISNIIALIREMVLKTYPCLVVCLLFALFIVVNGSVVVGDKQAHKAVFHPMQCFYFLDFAAFFGLPYFAVQVVTKRKVPNASAFVFLTGVAVVLSEVNKLEHPYLLADNRHLAFYVWKKIFGHDIVRRAVVPTYAVAGIVLFDLLGHCNFMFRVCLSLCIFFNLSLQHLFELRYFIIPYVMCRLHFRQNVSVWLESAFLSLINAGAIYLFLSRSFRWASEPDAEQRFIW